MLTTARLDIMKLHRDNWHLALRLAPFFPEGTVCNFFSCSLLRGDGSSDGILLAETTQTTVVQSFGLALFKQSEAADIDAILQKSFDDCGFKIDEVDTDSLDVKTMAVCSDGFFPQAKMDMKAMDVMAKVLLKKNVTSALRNMVRKLLANRNKMSTPFRSLTSTRGSGDKKKQRLRGMEIHGAALPETHGVGICVLRRRAGSSREGASCAPDAVGRRVVRGRQGG